MDRLYFNTDENFEKIIRNVLTDEEITDIDFIPTGWTNIVYEVSTKNGNYFFRFPRDEFWSKTIVKDYEFAKYIYNKTDFNTSKLELFYDNSRPFSVHKKIPGKPLAEKYNNLTNEEIKNISNQIAKFMYQLHTLEHSENDIFTIDNVGLNLHDFLTELLDLHVNDNDKKFWNSVIPMGSNCLVHGDLNSSNVLLDENNDISAIIDFGFGGFGNKYYDIARIIGRCPIEFKQEIIKSYETYSNAKLNLAELDSVIDNWTNIDNGYINYMKTIGIYS